MTRIDRAATTATRSPLWLTALYGVVLLSGLALATLVVGDIVYALQSGAGEHQDFPIFDLAWPVFLITGAFTLLAGIGALVAGKRGGNKALSRYGVWALGYCALAVVVVALSEVFGS